MCASKVARWSQEAHCDPVTYVNDPGEMDIQNIPGGSLIGSSRSGLDGPYHYGEKNANTSKTTGRKAREFVLREKE